ncbi:hypothetical protein RJ55_10045 [Drechmeria coniospora]|nr:hypothetical protein RJ55_10045 [Drechmeria coniospora]
MDCSSSQPFDPYSRRQESSAQQPSMSILTMSASSPHPMFRNDYSYGAVQTSSEAALHPRDNRPVSLPSIRQTFPELHLDGLRAPGVNQKLQTVAPLHTLASPEYVHSPNSNKRRRVSIEADRSPLRANQVPRLYRSPEQLPHGGPSPPHERSSVMETWCGPLRPGPYLPGGVAQAPLEVNGRADPRLLSLPSLPPAAQREPTPMHHSREVVPVPTGPTALERPPAYPGHDYGYQYQQPARYQPPLPPSSVRPHDNAPFLMGGPQYQEPNRYGELGSITLDLKQRKRRGNLPKETTDKLRSWFVAHLHHPYPSEEEKQELMRQTGLLMNQISNWFINARRRQLPAMISNARAESAAMNGRTGSIMDGKILATTERGVDHGAPGNRRGVKPLSDGEGSTYEEEMGHLGERRASAFNRESI